MRKLDTKILESPSTDPWLNLAIEEYLLDRVEDGAMTLYLWQNDRTVVIGRNQNAWRECRTDLLEKEGGRLARRLSGGGAVYHDLGNCNFTFLATSKAYDFLRQVKVLIGALRNLGIDAEFGGRNDITAAGRKISGNAFYRGKSGRFHHGTILISVDMDRMGRYLLPSRAKLAAKGVVSIRSRVANLCEIKPGVEVEDVRNALRRSFQEEFGHGRILDPEPLMTDETVVGLRKRYASRSWVYGKTPDFDLEMEHRFDWGEIQLGLAIKKGVVAECKVFTDAIEAESLEDLGGILVGAVPDGKAFAERIRCSGPGILTQEMKDILDWLESHGREIL
ncbi:MAG: lipoate--protein ligase [Thermovirga sp.]